MTCIFCLLSGLDPSDEHVIEMEFGAELIIRDVCVGCNSRLGHDVDDKLVNHLLMRFKRATHQLAGQ